MGVDVDGWYSGGCLTDRCTTPVDEESCTSTICSGMGKLTVVHSRGGATRYSPVSSGKTSRAIQGAPLTRSPFHNRAPDSRPAQRSSRSNLRHWGMPSSTISVPRADNVACNLHGILPPYCWCGRIGVSSGSYLQRYRRLCRALSRGAVMGSGNGKRDRSWGYLCKRLFEYSCRAHRALGESL